MPSIGDALTRANVGGQTMVLPGIDVDSKDSSGIAAALKLVQAADATVLVLGITKAQEHEGIDRSTTALPGLQTSFAQMVLNATKGPVIIVTISGGMISIDTLIAPASAIVDAFNPTQQGPTALAATLFGDANRWGKLPITIYNESYAPMIKIQDMSFTTPPGQPPNKYLKKKEERERERERER